MRMSYNNSVLVGHYNRNLHYFKHRLWVKKKSGLLIEVV